MPPVLLPAALSWALVLGAAFFLASGGAPAPARRGLRALAGEVTAVLVWPLLVALLADAFLVGEVLRGYPYTASDFEQYCGSVAAALRGEAAGWSHQRSWFAGRPAVWLGAGADAFTGLVRSARVGHAAVLVLVALHARALATRRAAVLAAVATAAASPVLILSRTVTFTPWLVVAALLPGAGAALALRSGRAPALFAAGAAAGLALLLDPRAPLFALPALALAAVAALRGPARPPAPSRAARAAGAALRVLLLSAPLVASFHIAARFGDAQAMPLEAQLAFHTRDLWLAAGAAPPPFFAAAPHSADGFVWGHRPPALFLQRTLPWIWRLATDPTLRPPAAGSAAAAVGAYVAPWLPAAGAGAALLLWAWRRRPVHAALLLATLAAPLGALVAALGSLPHPRHLASGAATLATLSALGLALLTARGPRAGAPADAPLPLRPRGGRLPAGAITALLVLALALLGGPARHSALRWAIPIDASGQPADVADPARRAGWARDCLGDIALPARPARATRGPPPPPPR